MAMVVFQSLNDKGWQSEQLQRRHVVGGRDTIRQLALRAASDVPR
jgi:hypothetical protein